MHSVINLEKNICIRGALYTNKAILIFVVCINLLNWCPYTVKYTMKNNEFQNDFQWVVLIGIPKISKNVNNTHVLSIWNLKKMNEIENESLQKF